MTISQALSRIYETYSEDELLNAKDEPDYEIIERFSGRPALLVLFGDDPHGTNAIRRRAKRAFQRIGHGCAPAEALANARRILKQDQS